MRRVIPFYNWTRKNVPFQLSELAQRPGGMVGSAVKGLDSLRDTEGFLPDQISEGMAIPVGTNSEGTSRFLTHFGLPVEDAFSFLGTGGEPATRTLEKLAGMTNPLIKGPLETLAGKQMYSGRSLDDLHSLTGSTALEQAIMNSPLSRLYTTSRQMFDPRKDAVDKLMTLTGPAKITDVDTVKQEELAAREVAAAALKGAPGARNFEAMYVKPEMLPYLSPQEMEMYRLYRYLESRRQEQAKAKKGAK
jgi:hypothetical protein